MPGAGDGVNGHAARVDFADSGNLETAVETLLKYSVDESVKSCMHVRGGGKTIPPGRAAAIG